MGSRSRRSNHPRQYWPYPIDLHEFITFLDTSLDDVKDARVCLRVFMDAEGVDWFPRPLYRRLLSAGLLPDPRRHRFPYPARRTYPYDLRDFLSVLGVTLDNHYHACTVITLFMLSPDGRRMPRSLRKALINAGVLDPDYVRALQAQIAAEKSNPSHPSEPRAPPTSSPSAR